MLAQDWLRLCGLIKEVMKVDEKETPCEGAISCGHCGPLTPSV